MPVGTSGRGRGGQSTRGPIQSAIGKLIESTDRIANLQLEVATSRESGQVHALLHNRAGAVVLATRAMQKRDACP